MKVDAACLWAWIPWRNVKVPAAVKTEQEVSKHSSGELMSFLPFKCVTFSSGPPTETLLGSNGSKPELNVCTESKMYVTAHVRIYNKYVCLCVWVKFSFVSFTQFIKMNLLRGPAPSVSVLPPPPPPSFCGATASILYYGAYLLRPCVYIQSSTRFLLTLEAELTSKNYSFSGQFCRPDLCLL